MTCMGPEIETLTSEDFGFKKLGQNKILPSYNERLPYASLQNLDICNYSSLYVACSGNKIVIGKLQELRGYIQSDAQSEISFIWEKEVSDVIAVKLILDEKLIYVTKQSQVFELDLHKLGEPVEIFKFDYELVHVKIWRNSVLLTLDSNGRLKSFHLAQRKESKLLEGVSAFDVLHNRLYAFFKSFSVQIYELQNWDKLSEILQFGAPTELVDEIREEYVSISIVALNLQECELVFGIPVSDGEEDVSYDHKIFVVKKIDDKITFQESFDMTPAFGSVLRYPIYYIERLSHLIKNAPEIDILASSCSSEISIWDSDKVVQPLQDSERAVLPVSKVTDNDTNPVGISLDVVTEGAVEQPCPGVDTIDKLPLIYLLDNEGSLQIIGFYHATAIKEEKFDVNALRLSIIEEESSRELPFKEESSAENEPKQSQRQLESLEEPESEVGGEDKESKAVHGELENAHSNSKVSLPSNESSLDKSTFGKSPLDSSALKESPPSASLESAAPAFGQPSLETSLQPSVPTFGKPSFGTTTNSATSAFGQPSFGTSSDTSTSAFGKPFFGASQNSSAPAFGQPSFGTSLESSAPVFGKPAFGAPEKSSESPFGKPSFDTSSNSTASVFGKPSFGASEKSSAPAFGKLSFDTSSESSKPAFGKPSFGTSSNSSAAVFGQPAFGKPEFAASSGSTFEKPVFGNPAFGKPSFGKLSFGQSPFASISNDSDSSTFGKPSFGSNNGKGFGAFAFSKEKSPFEISTSGSSFEEFAKSSSKNESPFASLIKKENNDNKFLFGVEKKQEDGKLKPEQPKIESSTSYSALTDIKTSSRPSTSGSANTITTPEKSTLGPCALGNTPGTKTQSPFAALAKDENLPVFVSPSCTGNKSRTSFGSSSPSRQRFSPVSPVGKDHEKEEEKCRNVNGDRDSEEEQPSSEKEPSPAHDKNLTHSTEGREPAGSESSISSLTAKIKDTAILPTNNLESTSVSQKSKSDLKSEKIQSPFAQYTNDIKEPSSTGFIFSKVPVLNKGKEASDNEFKLQISSKEDKKQPQIPESPGNELTERETSENEAGSLSGESIGSYLDRKAEFGKGNESQIKVPEVQKENEKESSSSTEPNEESREESYDTLDDITRGELENARLSAEDRAEFRKARSETKELDSGNKLESLHDAGRRELQTHSSPPILVGPGNTVIDAHPGNVSPPTRANTAEVSDFNVQDFENKNRHLASQYKPIPIPEYFCGANVTNIKYSSQEPVLKFIEKTYYYISAEIAVLLDNVSLLDKFFEDQCLRVPVEMDEGSITNMYQWRIPDASKLQTILNNKSGQLKELYDNIKTTSSRSSELEEKSIDSLRNKLALIRDEYDNLEKLNHGSQKGLGELSYHQSEKQSGLRRKMFKTFEMMQNIEELLQNLKLYTLQGKQMHDNSYLLKLAKGTTDHEKLLHEIGRLREDIKHLKMEDKRPLKPRESVNMASKDILSIEVAQVGLRLNTKRQLGSILKKRRNIET